MRGWAADFEEFAVLEALGELTRDALADLVVEYERIDLGVDVYNAVFYFFDFGVHLVVDGVLEFLVHAEDVVLLFLQDLVQGHPLGL